MWKYPIVEEIRQVRFDIEAECDNDFEEIFADAARIQKDLTNQVVSKPASNTQKDGAWLGVKYHRLDSQFALNNQGEKYYANKSSRRL